MQSKYTVSSVLHPSCSIFPSLSPSPASSRMFQLYQRVDRSIISRWRANTISPVTFSLPSPSRPHCDGTSPHLQLIPCSSESIHRLYLFSLKAVIKTESLLQSDTLTLPFLDRDFLSTYLPLSHSEPFFFDPERVSLYMYITSQKFRVFKKEFIF